jgi:nucleoside-diphosphate-sugar epimerase
MSILVTGAGGFIGSHLARYLKSKGYDVIGVDIKKPEYMNIPSMCTQFVLCDLRNRANVENLFKTYHIEEVYNLAANMGGIGYITEVAAQIIRDNAMINLNMLELSRIHDVERFFFSSSACAYPHYKQLETLVSLKETDAVPAEPEDFYGWEKLFTEKVCEAYRTSYNMDIKVARYHNIYGPEGTWRGGREKAPAALCRKIALCPDGGSIELWGDGKQTRSFCYIDDCIEGTVKLMNLNKHEWNDFLKKYNISAINIGSDRLISINELADLITELSGKKIKRTYNPFAWQGVRGRNSDNTLLKNLLHWEPHHTLEMGLDITYKWIKQQVG